MSRSPVVARRRLGAALRDLRTSANLKIDDAARTLECSSAKVSRLENGKGVPRQRDVRDLIDLYGDAARAQKDALLQLVAESLSEGEGLITDFRDVFEGDMVSDDVTRYVALEQDAAAIRLFEPDLVPGPLQTEAYADAVARLFYPDHDDAQRKRFVKLRLERQQLLTLPRADRPEYSMVVGEQALHRPVGGVDVMRSQLEHIAVELKNGLGHVGFRVAPLTLVHAGVLGGPFAVIEFADKEDQDVVFLEGRDGSTYLESDDQVKRYDATFASLADACPDRARSIEIVEDTAKTT